MKIKKLFFMMFLLIGLLAMSLFVRETGVNGAVRESGEKTLSPYFFVKSDDTDDTQVDQFSLKSTDVQANIAGVIADVTVTQVYENHGQKPLETIYIFPASTRAAVYAMKMTIGERTIIAKIKEKEEARRDYENAKAAGKSASLLEQHRPNVFQMNVANILPGDVIKVELKYTELLVPTNGIYEFMYPTVVGPRYSNQPESKASSDKWIQNPYLKQGEKSPSKFNIKVNLASAIPIGEASVSTHKTTTKFEGAKEAVITLASSETNPGNRDFILKYRHAGGNIESGILLYEGEKENFFLLMVEPPKKVSLNNIPKREYIFIVDISGSMHGFPLDTSKTLLRDLISNLRSTDIFNVLLFAGSSSVMSEKSVPATTQNINKAISLIERQRGGGSTQLIPALKRAFAMGNTEDYSRTVVIVTDGYVGVEKDSFELIRENLGKANVFSFGIGSSVNRFLIEGMARAGNGEPFIVTKQNEANGQARKLREIINSPVLTNIDIDYGTFNVYDISPNAIQDVFAKKPVVVFGKWKGSKSGNIILTGVTGQSKKYEKQIKVSDAKTSINNKALRYLWARKRIELLDDYNKLDHSDRRVKEVTQLGLKYNLLTAYTSFVAVDSEVRLKDGRAVTVKQPLPLPEGVSDLAVGNKQMAGKPRRKMLSRSSLGAGRPAPSAPLSENAEAAVTAYNELSKLPAKNEREEFKSKEKDRAVHSQKTSFADSEEVNLEAPEETAKSDKTEGSFKTGTDRDDSAKKVQGGADQYPTGYSVYSEISPGVQSSLDKSNLDEVANLKIEISKIKTTGKIDKKGVEKLFKESLSSLNQCQLNAIHSDKNSKGEVWFYIELSGDGKVLSANGRVISGRYKNTALLRCLLDKIKKLKYSKPSDGKKATIAVWIKTKV